ncbi:hypothetical protein [Cyanobium sp. ATX-6F1]|uniref:hypothetical protein n=1 Tax=Cyanobium sp. ATX-6F1 TaxID=3137388 RepID=UPI0039BE1832
MGVRRELLLLRHGIAQERSPALEDAARALTPRAAAAANRCWSGWWQSACAAIT